MLIEGDSAHLAVSSTGSLSGDGTSTGVKAGATRTVRVCFVGSAVKTLLKEDEIGEGVEVIPLAWGETPPTIASLLRALIGQESSEAERVIAEAATKTAAAKAAAKAATNPFKVGAGLGMPGMRASKPPVVSMADSGDDEEDDEDDEASVLPKWMREAKSAMSGDWMPDVAPRKISAQEGEKDEHGDLGALASKLHRQGLDLGDNGSEEATGQDKIMQMIAALGSGGSKKEKMMMAMMMTMMMEGKESGGSDGNWQGKAYKRVYQRRRRPYTEPEAVIREYVAHVRKRLGAGAGDRWQFHQLSTLIDWTKFRGFARVHFHCSHILRLMLGGYTREAAAYMCMILRAMNQVMLDGGGWSDASLLLPEEDPLGKVEWAAEENDIEGIATFRSAQSTLRRQRQNNWKAGPEDYEDAPAPRKKWWQYNNQGNYQKNWWAKDKNGQQAAASGSAATPG